MRQQADTWGKTTEELRCHGLCMGACYTCELQLQERLGVAFVEYGHSHASLFAPCLQTSQTSPLKAAKLPFPRSALPAFSEALTTADASQPAMQFVGGLPFLIHTVGPNAPKGSMLLWTRFSIWPSLCCLHTCCQLNCDYLRSLQQLLEPCAWFAAPALPLLTHRLCRTAALRVGGPCAQGVLWPLFALRTGSCSYEAQKR